MRTRPWTIRKRRLAGLMAVVMLLLPLSLPIGAEDAAPALPARIVAEDTAQRGINSKTFTLSDGTYLAVAYPEAVHYQTQSGFAAIDNSFVPAVMVGDAMTGQIRRTDDLAAAQAAPAVSGTAYWANRDNPFSVALPQRLDARAPVVLRHGRHTLRFAAEVAANTAVWSVPEAAEDANAADDIDLTDPAQVRAANDRDMAAPNARAAVSFPGAWTNADLHYAVAGQKLKESILLHDVPQQSDFSFLFAYDTDILRAEVQEDGSVCLTDNEGETAFFIEAPVMFDSGEGYTNAVAVTVEEIDGGCRYTLTPDRAWLTDSARVYPVTMNIPAHVTSTQDTNYIHDNGVQESNPTTNYKTLDRIYVGTSASGKEGRMYFKLTQWPTADGMDQSTITSASFNLRHYPQANWQTAHQLTIDIYTLTKSWDTNTITWDTQKTLCREKSVSGYIAEARKITNSYASFDVTKWVKSHYAAPELDYGICLQPSTIASEENRICFISSDYYTNTSQRPILYIYYAKADAIKSIRHTKIQKLGAPEQFMHLYVYENYAGNVFYQSSDMYDAFGSIYDINDTTKAYLNNGYQAYYDAHYQYPPNFPLQYKGVYYGKQQLQRFLNDNPQIVIGSDEYYGLWIDSILLVQALEEYSALVTEFVQTASIIASAAFQAVLLVKNTALLINQTATITRHDYLTTASTNAARIEAARRAQINNGYAADEYRVTVLKKGSKVYGLLKGQSAWYTTKEMVEKSGYDQLTINHGLQIPPDPVRGYRTHVAEYLVKEDIVVPVGQALNNTYYNGAFLGNGGYTQYYISQFASVLKYVSMTPLTTN